MRNIQEIIGSFIKTRAELESRLAVSMLVGEPYVLVLMGPEYDRTQLSLRPVLGELYPDQQPIKGKYAFRLQRRNDLCGCPHFTPERAKHLTEQFKSEGIFASAVHYRDWLRDNLAGTTKSLNMLMANQHVTENFADA